MTNLHLQMYAHLNKPSNSYLYMEQRVCEQPISVIEMNPSSNDIKTYLTVPNSLPLDNATGYCLTTSNVLDFNTLLDADKSSFIHLNDAFNNEDGGVTNIDDSLDDAIKQTLDLIPNEITEKNLGGNLTNLTKNSHMITLTIFVDKNSNNITRIVYESDRELNTPSPYFVHQLINQQRFERLNSTQTACLLPLPDEEFFNFHYNTRTHKVSFIPEGRMFIKSHARQHEAFKNKFTFTFGVDEVLYDRPPPFATTNCPTEKAHNPRQAIIIMGGTDWLQAYNDYSDNVLQYFGQLYLAGYYVKVFYGGPKIGEDKLRWVAIWTAYYEETGKLPTSIFRGIAETYEDIAEKLEPYTSGIPVAELNYANNKSEIRNQIQRTCQNLNTFVTDNAEGKGNIAIFTTGHGKEEGLSLYTPCAEESSVENCDIYKPEELVFDMELCRHENINKIGVFDQCFSGVFPQYFSEEARDLINSGNYFAASRHDEVSYGREYANNLNHEYSPNQNWSVQEKSEKVAPYISGDGCCGPGCETTNGCDNFCQQCDPFYQMHCVASGKSRGYGTSTVCDPKLSGGELTSRLTSNATHSGDIDYVDKGIGISRSFNINNNCGHN